MRWLGLFALIVAVPTVAQADRCEARLPTPGTAFSGIVRYVGDGDSLCVGRSPAPPDWIEVRLADFYAPELSEAGGPEAKRALERMAMGREVQCRAGKRSYDRVVGACTLKGQPLGRLMRRAGLKEGGRGR